LKNNRARKHRNYTLVDTTENIEIGDLIQIIEVAVGRRPADLLLKGVNLVNVLSGEVYPTNVALIGERIAGVGPQYKKADYILSLSDKYLLPGLIDGHVHIESSMVSVPEFAKAVIPHGTTTIIIDPHEIANVLGGKGIEYLLKSSQGVPLGFFVMVPSCVPATEMETAGAELAAEEMVDLFRSDRVLGLAELMNFPGVIYAVPHVLKKVAVARLRGKLIDGHAPGLSGTDLNAYISSGVGSDHECTSVVEATEKLRAGMWIMIREGSAAKNLTDLLPLVKDSNYRRCFFVTDDRHPGDLIKEGHMDHILRKAVSLGLDPVRTVQMASINTAEYFGLKGLGAVAPGYIADLVVVEDLSSFRVRFVIKDGKIVAEDGKLTGEIKGYEEPSVYRTMNVAPLSEDDFKIRATESEVKVIGLVPDQIITRSLREGAKSEGRFIVADPERDVLKLAVIERHKATGNVGLGLVKGFGLRSGALASSFAHDSHNIVVVGVDDRDMLFAAEEVIRMGGGYVVADQGKILGRLPLPIAGLMSDRSVQEVQEDLEKLHELARELGVKVRSPFITLSFLSLPVIPELKLTDKGLVDVAKFKLVPIGNCAS